MNEFERLEKQYRDGEISYDELVDRGGKAADRAERNCAHQYTTVEDSSGSTG